MNTDRHRFFLWIYTNFFAFFAPLREIFCFSTTWLILNFCAKWQENLKYVSFSLRSLRPLRENFVFKIPTYYLLPTTYYLPWLLATIYCLLFSLNASTDWKDIALAMAGVTISGLKKSWRFWTAWRSFPLGFMCIRNTSFNPISYRFRPVSGENSFAIKPLHSLIIHGYNAMMSSRL